MATFDDYVIRITERGAKETASAIGVVGKESERATGFVAGLNRTLFALGSAFSVKSVLEYTSTWQAMTNTLKIVTKDTAELTAVQDRLFKQAQSNRTNIEALTDLYQKLRLSQKEVGVSGENLFRVTDIVSKAMTVAGKSGQAATNGLRQFVQGLVSGKIQGEELRSVLENTPYLAKTLADGLMVPVGALRELGAAGKLTSRQVVEALLRMEQSVNKEFGKTSVTISQAITILENAFTRFVGQSGEVSTASSVIANGIILIANNIDKLAIALAVAAGSWITYRIAVASVAAAQLIANAAINANPIVRMVTIIASVVAGLSLLTGGTEKWSSAIKSLGEITVSVFNWITTSITAVSGWFTQLSTDVTTTATAVSSSFTEAFDDVMSYLKNWYDWLSDLVTNRIPKAFRDAVNSVVKFFTDGFNAIKDMVMGVINTITTAIQNFVQKAMNWFNQIIQAAKTAAGVTGGSGGSGGNYGGERAAGGSVLKGRTYLVGEDGPELWTANQNGYIVPHGGSGGSPFNISNDNSQSVSVMIAEGFREALGEQFTELLDTTKSNNNLLTQIAENTKQLSEQVKQNSQTNESSGSNTSGGFSAINNFGQGVISQNQAMPSNLLETGGGGNRGSSGGSGSTADTGNYPLSYIQRWAKEYANYFNEQRRGLRYKNELEAQYAANRWLNATVPSSAHGAVQEMSNQYKIATQVGATIQFRSGGQLDIPGFASGGSFTVPGSTGVDSKLVNMRVSPGEQIDIRTRKQVREEREDWGSKANNTNVTFHVQATDANSFRRSKKQISRDLLRTLMRDTA